MLRISFDTALIGQHFLHFPVCESTNAIVMQKLAGASIQEGTLVLADFQTQGRGQRHAHWEGSAGLNLTFTVALFPNLPVQNQFYLNFMATLAITDCLSEHKLKIKWPNDIYSTQFKLSGILIQNNLKVNKIQSSAVGIGLNVNQMHFNYPQATSLRVITDQVWDRISLLQKLAGTLEERYFQLKEGEYQRLKQDYLSRLYRKDEWHTYRDEQGTFEGKIVGIDAEGRLLVERNKTIRTYDLKEIVFL